MRDHRGHDDEVEALIRKRQCEGQTAHASFWIIKIMGNVEMTELEIGIARSDVLAAPVNATDHRINTGIACLRRVEILR